MKKRVLYILIFLYGFISQAQECPSITSPVDGSLEVPVNTTITWNAVDGIVGYLISLGTTPGGTEILNRRSAGLINSFTPEVGLPDDSLIYVTIEMFLPGQQIVLCPGESFRTVNVTEPPSCTTLSDPLNNAVNSNVNGKVNWNYAPTATGYNIRIGTSSGGSEIIETIDVGNVLTYKPSEELPLDEEIFVQIVPYNENGDAGNCASESFTTGVQTVDCLLYFDAATGATVKLSPEINFPDQIGVCSGDGAKQLKSTDRARGFRWFKINTDGSETLLSETDEVSIDVFGTYRYEAYNTITQFGATIECASVKEFMVVSSEPAVINAILVSRESNGLEIDIQVSGSGSYEYALDNSNGPFQDSSSFAGIPPGEHIAYVRDKNGCGITERLVERNLNSKDFPNFFTPNGDGINDFWQFAPPADTDENIVESLWIYDKYGNLMAQIDPRSKGWSGNFQGRPLPSSDYWFKAITFNRRKILGHFTLKR
ncbi:MAG: T9SS type B sorting domain-containing protein [Maribacter sp.]